MKTSGVGVGEGTASAPNQPPARAHLRQASDHSDLKGERCGRDHIVVDFPIKGPAHAKALPEELPPLMPDLAEAQDDLGTVHFSRFLVEGDEKLLFLSDIDGEVNQHVERLVEHAAGP